MSRRQHPDVRMTAKWIDELKSALWYRAEKIERLEAQYRSSMNLVAQLPGLYSTGISLKYVTCYCQQCLIAAKTSNSNALNRVPYLSEKTSSTVRHSLRLPQDIQNNIAPLNDQTGPQTNGKEHGAHAAGE